MDLLPAKEPAQERLKRVVPLVYAYFFASRQRFLNSKISVMVKKNPDFHTPDDLHYTAINKNYVSGKTQNRQTKVDEFQTNDSIPFFLISLKAGDVGLNLTAADYVIHLDP